LNPRVNLGASNFRRLNCDAKKSVCRRIRLSRVCDRFGCVWATTESERDTVALANIDARPDFHSDANSDADRDTDPNHNAK